MLGFANRRLLGKLPEEALTGSYQEEKPPTEATSVVSISTPEGDIVAADQVELVSDAPVVNGSNGATAHAANGASSNGVAAPTVNGVNGATSLTANDSNGASAPQATDSQQVFRSTVDEADQESIQDAISVQVFNKDTIIEVKEEEKAVQTSA